MSSGPEHSASLKSASSVIGDSEDPSSLLYENTHVEGELDPNTNQNHVNLSHTGAVAKHQQDAELDAADSLRISSPALPVVQQDGKLFRFYVK